MVQTFITTVIVAVATYFIVKKAIETIRHFRKPAPCRGCSGACNTCPITEFPHSENGKKTLSASKEKQSREHH